jgi:hypothetical protein
MVLARGVHRIRVAYFQGPRFEVALILKIARPGEILRVFNTDDFKPPADAAIDPQPAEGRVQIDNEFVRAISMVVAPHEKTEPAGRPLPRVIVYLDKGAFQIRNGNGAASKHDFRAGSAVWSPAEGIHTRENTGRAPVRMVEIELKKPAPVVFPARLKELDPLAIDPKHNILLFENDQVRVFRSWREPGASELLHEHTGVGRVAVFLTDIDAVIRGDGQETSLHAPAGEVSWSGPAKHAAVNTGSRKFEMIVVEVK